MLWSVWSEEEPSLQIMLSRNALFHFNWPLIFMNRMSPDFKISLNLVAYVKRKEGFFCVKITSKCWKKITNKIFAVTCP